MRQKNISDFDLDSAGKLLEILESNGSDKGNRHHYYFVYNYIFEQLGLESKLRLLEVGLGTNNPGLVSAMERLGVPGASVRAFRDFLPKAMIYGTDVDRNNLFEEEYIETGSVNQLNADCF